MAQVFLSHMERRVVAFFLAESLDSTFSRASLLQRNPCVRLRMQTQIVFTVFAIAARDLKGENASEALSHMFRNET